MEHKSKINRAMPFIQALQHDPSAELDTNLKAISALSQGSLPIVDLMRESGLSLSLLGKLEQEGWIVIGHSDNPEVPTVELTARGQQVLNGRTS